MITYKPKIKAGKRQKVAYFGYSKATAGGGATIKSTSSGGGTTRSTSSGGGSSQTSSSGGGTSTSTQSGGSSSQTSSNTGTHRHLMFAGDSNNMRTTPSAEFKHYYAQGTRDGAEGAGLVRLDSVIGDIYTYSADGAHSHSVNIPAHTHNFTVPSHTHNVNIPNHTHDVTIPNHSHEIDLPNHTHDVQHEIVELSELPSSVTIKVDGNVVPHTSTSGNRINLVDYMEKDSNGRITRGRHEVEILPNGLARIEADLICRVFIQSQLGGTY